MGVRALLAIATTLAVLGTTADAAVYDIRKVAATGDIVPGTTASFFNFGRTPSLNANGEVAFFANVRGADSSIPGESGIFSNAGTDRLTLRAAGGRTAPGTNATFSYFWDPSLNAVGDVAFRGYLAGPGVDRSNDDSIFKLTSDGLRLVARGGDPVPGTAATFSRVDLYPRLNARGETTFFGYLRGAGVDERNNHAVFREVGNDLELVVRTGEPAPGSAASFAQLQDLNINANGGTSFVSRLSGPDVDASNGTAVFSETDGEVRLVARTGEPAPGTAATFADFNGRTSLSAEGDIAFRAFLTGADVDDSNDAGIFREVNGGLSLVARKGDVAPGTDAVFAFLGFPSRNPNGDITFAALLEGERLDNLDDIAIFTETNGEFELVVRTGDRLDLGGGNLQTISTLYNADVFTDDGTVAFFAEFLSGAQGVFIASPQESPAVVPVPAALPLFATALIGLGLLRQLRRSSDGA